jgi:hypothetical protein
MPTLPRTLLALLLVVPVTGGASVAAEVLGRPAAEPRARLTVATASPLFTAENLRPGDRATACTTIANAGDAPGRAALFAGAERGPLARYLELRVVRGRVGATCARFAPDARAFAAPPAEPGLVYSGSLADFPADHARAVVDPDVWAPGATRAYRFALRLADDARAAGLSARWGWRLAVESLPERSATAASSVPADRCDRVRLAGLTEGARRRTLVRTVRISPQVSAVLVLRQSAGAAAPRLTMTTGLRVRGGKTLLIGRWARVRYRLNGTLGRVARRRPFRHTADASQFRLGRNRISVAVQPRRGRKRTTAFTVTVAGSGSRTCVVSA